MAIGYAESEKAYSLLQNAKAVIEQKMYFPKGSGEDLERLASALRSEAYDLLQGKTKIQEDNPQGGCISVDVNGLSQEQIWAFAAEINEVKKKFKAAKEEEPDAGSAQEPTAPTASIPKVTPTEAKADKPSNLIPGADDLPSNVGKGTRAPKVSIPLDTTGRKATEPK